MITRRSVLLGAAATALPLAVHPSWARTTLDLGDGVTLDTLSDGSLVLPGEFVFEPMPKDELAEVLAQFPEVDAERLTPPCNVTLLRDGERTILFDAGGGTAFQPTVGQLPDALDALGVAPEDVTHVIFTHAHPDHLWGVLDDFDDPYFSEAEHMIGAAEHAYWTDPATVEAIGEARQAFAVGAARRLEALDGITLIEDGDTVAPGVLARLTPGHTPGHMAFDVATPEGPVMVLGDAVANHHVALRRPEWIGGNDQEPERAAATRVALLAELAERGRPVIGFHFPEGGAGTIERDGEGYRFRASGG